jgi:hypothetical protein
MDFPGLVLVPAGGKGSLISFASLVENVFSKSIWGVNFYMLSDRDSVPVGRAAAEREGRTTSRFRVLSRYHLENYFLDERVLARVFAPMEPPDSWLQSPTDIRQTLRDIAKDMVPYAVALNVGAKFRDLVGNVDIMPKSIQGLRAEELADLMVQKARSEIDRVGTVISDGPTRDAVLTTMARLHAAVDNDDDQWKVDIPGRPVLHTFANRANMDPGRLKLLYVAAAADGDERPFGELFDIFGSFANHT